jgi:exopolysaccharide biosynthesis polyprenyl glycosylphosphotransferase
VLKNHWRLISRLERIADNLLIILAFYFGYTFRDDILFTAHRLGLISEFQAATPLGAIEQYYIVLGLSLPIYNALLELLGGYRSMRMSSALQIIRIIGVSSLLTFFCQGSLLYFLKLDISRSFVGLFCVLSGLSLFAERFLILALLRYFRIRGKNFRNVLVVGTGTQARTIYREIMTHQELGLRVVGFVSVLEGEQSSSHSEVYDLPARVVAGKRTFERALKKYAVDEVLITDAVESFSVLRELAQIAVEEGVRVTLTANIFSLEIFNSEMSYFGEVPLIHYSPSAGVSDSGAHVAKRVIDLVASALLLIVLSPLLLITALCIKLETPGPVFFKQRRVGLNGRIFTLLKFRSMVQGAEGMLPELLEKNEMSGPVFKMKEDPRVTKVGRFIRKYSIDELPQLLNVLRGDMSLVGPRPPLPQEVSLYERKQRKRLSMRPGLTCIWQVSGRNEILDFEKWAQLDLEYIDNWSLKKDFELILKTIPAVFTGLGAR